MCCATPLALYKSGLVSGCDLRLRAGPKHHLKPSNALVGTPTFHSFNLPHLKNYFSGIYAHALSIDSSH
ncbi:hypothetical protein V6N12_048076 [Hibiscus sabdariffa]|uniref:Uncharacterized protein n=1 Tax=Hibiscus sabdariffa TaxID=183260 RepID=A0ABR2CVB2_9ROSI